MGILSPKFVITSFESLTKKEAIIKLSTILFQEERLTDLDQFINNVMSREMEFSTGFGDGIAIPHGKTAAVKEPSLIVAKASSGIPWESLDEKPVHFIFLLAVPDEASGMTHLKIMAKLAENLMDDEVREELMRIKGQEKLYDFITLLLEEEK